MHPVRGEVSNMRCPLVRLELPEHSPAASIKDLQQTVQHFKNSCNTTVHCQMQLLNQALDIGLMLCASPAQRHLPHQQQGACCLSGSCRSMLYP